MRFFKHLFLITKHKFYVFCYSIRLGIPWRGFWHDLSKFSPGEFFRSVKYYQGHRSPILEERRTNEQFSMICIHHTKRNRHHWEAWIDHIQDGLVIKPMPYKYNLEYFCDIMSATKVYNKKNFKKEMAEEYFIKRKDNYILHPVNKLFMLKCFEILKIEGWRGLKKKKTKRLYEELSKDSKNYVISIDLSSIKI